MDAPPAYNFESREQELLAQISDLRKVMHIFDIILCVKL